MNPKVGIGFVVTQLFGELGPWMGLRMKSSLGPALWFVGIVVMMPGRLLGLLVTEKFLWDAGLTPPQFTAVFVVIEVSANLAVWLLCARLFRALRRRRAGDISAWGQSSSQHD
jgi:hypothetical protein